MALPVPLAFLFAQPALPDVRGSGGSRTSLARAAYPRDDAHPGARLPASTSLPEFERALREHLAAAHHLARWLTRTQADAQDVLQDAVLRAFRSLDRLRPVDPRPWRLRIQRNCCHDMLER